MPDVTEKPDDNTAGVSIVLFVAFRSFLCFVTHHYAVSNVLPNVSLLNAILLNANGGGNNKHPKKTK